MSDRYIQIANFKWGLDSRRAELLENPGSLLQIVNGHVNSGGEIEQRKSFAKSATAAPVTTFGFEATASGLVVFGSVANPGALPAGVLYRQCPHPTTFRGSAGVAAMTAVVSSCNYNGKAFVLATFDDGKTYGYYGDVSPMSQVLEITRNGTVIYGAANTVETLAQLAGYLNTILSTFSGFIATSNVDENGVALNGTLILKTSPGLHAGFTPSYISSSSGILQCVLVDQNNVGSAGSPASTSFYIVSGPGTIAVSAPSYLGGPTDLINGTLAWAGSAGATASAVVALINARTNLTGYSAKLGTGSNTSQIIIYAPLALGAAANATLVTVTTVTMVTATQTVPLSMQLSPNTATIGPNTSKVITASVIGLVGTPTFSWSIISSSLGSPSASGISFTDGSYSTYLTVHKVEGIGIGGQAFKSENATMQCKVTDGGTGNSVTQQFTVAVNKNI